jgi:hypothetical protein
MAIKVGCSIDRIKKPITVVSYFSRCSIDTGTSYAAPGQSRGMKLAEPPFSGHIDYDQSYTRLNTTDTVVSPRRSFYDREHNAQSRLRAFQEIRTLPKAYALV